MLSPAETCWLSTGIMVLALKFGALSFGCAPSPATPFHRAQNQRRSSPLELLPQQQGRTTALVGGHQARGRDKE